AAAQLFGGEQSHFRSDFELFLLVQPAGDLGGGTASIHRSPYERRRQVQTVRPVPPLVVDEKFVRQLLHDQPALSRSRQTIVVVFEHELLPAFSLGAVCATHSGNSHRYNREVLTCQQLILFQCQVAHKQRLPPDRLRRARPAESMNWRRPCEASPEPHAVRAAPTPCCATSPAPPDRPRAGVAARPRPACI